MAFSSKQQVDFLLSGGLDTKSDAFTVQPPSLLDLENGVFNKNNTIDKRLGFIELSNQLQSGGVIQNASAINTFEDELLIFDNKQLYTYLESTSNCTSRGVAISCVNSSNSIIKSRIYTQSNQDAVITTKFKLFAWDDSRGSVRYSLQDGYTNTFITYDTSLFPGSKRPKTSTNAQGALTLSFCTGNGILFNTINQTRPQILSNAVVAISDGYNLTSTSPTIYDAILENNNTTPTFAYQRSDLSIGLQLGTGSSTHAINAGIITTIALTKDSFGNYWIVWSGSTGTLVAAFTSSLSLITRKQINSVRTITNISIVEDPNNIGNMTIAWEQTDVNNLSQIWTTYIQSNAVIISSLVPAILKLGLVSKLFNYNNQTFILSTFASVEQPTQFLLLVSAQNNTATVVSKLNAQAASSAYMSGGCLSEVTSIQSGQFLIATNRTNSFQTNNGIFFYNTGVQASVIDFNHNNVFNSQTFSNNLITTGGIVQAYDGCSYTELNFHLFPELTTPTIVSGGALQTGSYGYSAIYEWCDNKGQNQRSQPSALISVAITAGQTTEWQLPTLTVTEKIDPRSSVLITLYRTTVNQSAPLNKVLSIQNDPTVDFITIYDDVADNANFLSNEPLYTASQVPNCAPPSAQFITLFQDRVCISGLEDPNLIYFSQAQDDNSNFNTLPPEFSPFFTISCSSLGGPITALFGMDDKLVIFKENHIFITGGDGPDALGGGTAFPTPQLLTTDAGCINQNSICSGPTGIYFESNKGIYLLGRDNSVQYIGQQVEVYNNLTITSSILLSASNQVVFTTLEGIALVHNYFFGRWSTWTNLPTQDAILWNDNLSLCTSKGFVSIQRSEDTNDGYAFTDTINNIIQNIQLKIQFPWLAFGQTQSIGHIYWLLLLGRFKDNHSLNVSIAYDYQDTDVEFLQISSNVVSNTWGSAPVWGTNQSWGGGVYTPYQFLIDPQDSLYKQSIRVTVWDMPLGQGVSTQGYQLVSLSALIGILPNGAIMPVSNKFGSSKR